MIRNDDGKRANVLVQWVSNKYLRDNRNELSSITVGPDEYLIILKGGEIEEIVTQSQVGTVPGFWRRLLERITGSPDTQLVIVDTRKHEVSIPFEAYSSDRVLIRGAATLFANVSKTDTELATRLLKEVGEFGSTYNGMGFREFCLEDLADLLRRNIEYIVDTEAISGYDSSEIQSRRREICIDIVSALNAKTPYWANYGLSVTYSSVSIDDNEFERLERVDRQNRLRQRQRDLAYADALGDSEQKIRIEDIGNRQAAAMDLNEYLSTVNLMAAKKARSDEIAQEDGLRRIDHEDERQTRKLESENRLRTMALYHQQEIARITGDGEISEAEKRVKIAEIELRLSEIGVQSKKQQFDFDSYMEDTKLRRQREQMRFETDLEIEKKSREADVLMKLSQREDDLRDKRQDHSHEETMASINADVTKAAYANDGARLTAEGDAKAARAELSGFREANGISHRQNMDSAAMTERMIYAASGKAPSEAERRVYCPRCGMALDPKAKFCTNCGSKLQED